MFKISLYIYWITIKCRFGRPTSLTMVMVIHDIVT